MHTFSAVDLFSGAGGATQGLIEAGFRVLGAIEIDRDSAASYRLNHPNVRLVERDIRNVAASTFARELSLKAGQLDVLKACPPCQGFSSLSEGRVDEDAARNDLVLAVVRFVRAFLPRAVLIENVPGLQRNHRFVDLVNRIEALGYATKPYVVRADEFGVPQRRRRLIFIALRGRRRVVDLPIVLKGDGSESRTVNDALAALDGIDLREDGLNRHRTLSPKTLQRVRLVPRGGGRRDLPVAHQLDCHLRIDRGARGAASSYGRMRLDSPAPTMTTRCTTVACGRFIHPTEDRGITLREAAVFQTFPIGYGFTGGYDSIERQIGNAVPVELARQVSLIVRGVLESSG